jgi:hypothetical protein
LNWAAGFNDEEDCTKRSPFSSLLKAAKIKGFLFSCFSKTWIPLPAVAFKIHSARVLLLAGMNSFHIKVSTMILVPTGLKPQSTGTKGHSRHLC